MKYKSPFRESSNVIKEYIEYFKYAITEFDKMMKDSLYDDKQIAKFTSSIEVQRYKRRLQTSYYSIAKTSVISKLKYSVQYGLLTRGFVNKLIKIVNETGGIAGLSGGGSTPEIQAYKNVCMLTLQKISKLL